VAIGIPRSGEQYVEAIDDHIRQLLALREGATDPPSTPQYAATVMLIREDPVEVFMIQRAHTMAFMPDVVVFPGGRADPSDADPDLGWVGPSPGQWAERMGLDETSARMVVVAATREVFEETGVLLAGPDADTLVRLDNPGSWVADRERLARHGESFAGFLKRKNLVLRSDLLGLRSRWLTPEYEPRRYDTFFFAALVPPGQTPDSQTREAARGLWAEPTALMEVGDAGKLLLVSPTEYNLFYLAQAPSGAQFVAENPPVSQITMYPRIDDGETVLYLVWP
jgi:8-oxo-dGTP pyrophosphatase MutT (NUDIX family)